jgi:hypothetical protein
MGGNGPERTDEWTIGSRETADERLAVLGSLIQRLATSNERIKVIEPFFVFDN